MKKISGFKIKYNNSKGKIQKSILQIMNFLEIYLCNKTTTQTHIDENNINFDMYVKFNFISEELANIVIRELLFINNGLNIIKIYC